MSPVLKVEVSKTERRGHRCEVSYLLGEDLPGLDSGFACGVAGFAGFPFGLIFKALSANAARQT